MTARRKPTPHDPTEVPRRPPATTPEARENQLVALAYDTAEQQMLDRTASAQVITHFLKMGTARENLEREKLRHENELLQARRLQIEQQGDLLEMYSKALGAMREYQGRDEDVPDDVEVYDDRG